MYILLIVLYFFSFLIFYLIFMNTFLDKLHIGPLGKRAMHLHLIFTKDIIG